MVKTYMPHAAVRCSKSSDKVWRLSHLIDKKEYEVEPLIVAVVTLFSGGGTISEVVSRTIGISHSINENTLENIIACLIDSNIIVEKDDRISNEVQKLLEKWGKFGWSAAADYYLSSISFPFVEGTVYQYNEDDKQRMKSYYINEADLNRSKDYESVEEINLPLVHEALQSAHFNKNLTEVLNSNPSAKHSIKKNDVFVIASIAFGKYKSYPISLEGVADTIKKTSPSGGSRHPTEGYIILLQDIEDLSKGGYHFSVKKNALEKINSDFSSEDIKECFPGLCRIKVPKVIVVLSSLFERNMYRYREPRTFRSIFIDIGHLAENIGLLSKSIGLKCFGHTYIDFKKVEEMLQIDPLQEGIFYSLGIG